MRPILRIPDLREKSAAFTATLPDRLLRGWRPGLRRPPALPRGGINLFRLSFLMLAVVPAVLAFVYFALISSREYVSEARFTIRAGNEARSAVSDVVSAVTASFGGAPKSTTQDIFIVADYIRSRTIVQDVGGKPLMTSLYSRPEIDWLSRLDPDETAEGIWKYWRRKVGAVIDTPSGVITVSVRAFRREDANLLAQLIVRRSEALANEISERSRRDALNRAEREIKLASDRLEKARAVMLAFRNENNLIDPALSAKATSETLAKLTREKITLEYNKASISGALQKDSPTLRVLNAQIDALDQQIAKVQLELTGRSEDGALSGRIAGYESLQLAVEFGERLYTIAQASYEKARVEQEKQQLYLVTVENPSIPERASYPRVFLDTVLIFAVCLVIWSMLALLVAWIRDHAGG